MKAFRSLFAVILTCLIAWNGFVTPAFAASNSVDSFTHGFWEGLGGLFGAATGTVVVCYTVDAVIAPFAPPVAAYLTPMCPAIGATVGGFGGAATANAIAGAQ